MIIEDSKHERNIKNLQNTTHISKEITQMHGEGGIARVVPLHFPVAWDTEETEGRAEGTLLHVLPWLVNYPKL
jgi:hypothetical protein